MSEPRARLGQFVLISGPAGSGKTTIVDAALQRCPSIARLVTTTTRLPRPGEFNGVHYWFTGQDDFRARIAAGDFLEWAETHGHLYGSSEVELNRLLIQHPVVIGILDIKGTRLVRQKRPETYTVFIEAGSLREIRRRLELRPGITPQDLRTRLQTAVVEQRAAHEYDRIIVNRDGHLSEAIDRLVEIINGFLFG